MDAESCNKAFASKEEMVPHSEKRYFIKKIEQFPDFPGAVAHSTTEHVLPKSAEHPNLEQQIPTPNIQQNETKRIITNYVYISSVKSQEDVKSSQTRMLELDNFEHKITNYTCTDCGAKFRDKEKICGHALKVHKVK